MAKRKAAQLPTPKEAFPSRQPFAPGGTYAAVCRQADRYLAKAEEAVRTAACLWAEVDAGLETRADELAGEILSFRRESVTTVQDLYGDRLNESVF